MLFEKVLNFLFPNKCLICGKRNKEYLCINCYNRINRLAKNKVIKFKNKNLDVLIYLFKYEKLIRKLILAFKFFNKPYVYRIFTKIILKNEKLCGKIKNYDIIVPVPMHKIKKQLRGYNQTELLACEIAKKTQLLYESTILIKSKNNKMQSTLKEKERYENIKDAFYILNKDKIKDKNIILIDDIYTTGATLEACAKVLKEAGAKEVVGIVIAKD